MERVLDARGPLLGVFILLLVVIGFGATKLTVDPNNRVFFGPGHSKYSQLLDLEAQFGSNTSLLFLIISDSTLVDDPGIQDAILWVSDRAWGVDHVVSVDSLASLPHVEGDADELSVVGMLDFICPEPDRCVRDRAEWLEKPYIVNRYVGGDGKSFAVVAKVDLFDPSPDDVARIASSANALLQEFSEKFPSFDIRVTGGVPMMNAFVEAAKSDSSVLMVCVVLVLSLGLYVFLGGIVPAAIMISLGVSSVIVTMGLAGWAGHVVNTATATVPLIVFTLVVAAAMHVFLHIVREERLDSATRVRIAAITAIRANWRPVALTALTTAVGLLSMVFVSAPPLKELGVLSALGVLVGAGLTLIIVPCVFSLLPRIRASNYLLGIQGLMNEYAKWLERKRPRMFAVFFLFAIALSGIFWVDVDEDFVRYFDSSTPFRTDTEVITERLAGPYHIDIVYDSQVPAGVFDPRSIDDLRALAGMLRTHPHVVNTVSIVDVLAEVAEVMSGSRELADASTNDLAQYFLSYELSLGAGQTTTDLVDINQQSARVSVLLGDVTMGEIRELSRDIDLWTEDRSISDRVVVSGEGIPTAYLSSESIREMGSGIAVSIFISALVVGLYFRNVKACVSILVATIVPILAGFGVWGWIESEIGMAATLVVAITIGVVIDDTIHLTYRYVDSLRNLDLTPWGATAYSIHKTGTAIVVTSLVLVAGLMVLVISDFRMNSTFGLCSSLVISLALVYNLTVAPRLLNQLR